MHFSAIEVRNNRGLWHHDHLPFFGVAPGKLPPDRHRRAKRDAIEPTRQLLARTDRVRLAGQDQEGGLKRILGILQPADYAMAHSEDHCPVAADQGSESGFISTAKKIREQLTIAPLPGFNRRHSAAELIDNVSERRGSH